VGRKNEGTGRSCAGPFVDHRQGGGCATDTIVLRVVSIQRPQRGRVPQPGPSPGPSPHVHGESAWTSPSGPTTALPLYQKRKLRATPSQSHPRVRGGTYLGLSVRPSPHARGILRPTIVGASPGRVGDISTIVDIEFGMQALTSVGVSWRTSSDPITGPPGPRAATTSSSLTSAAVASPSMGTIRQETARRGPRRSTRTATPGTTWAPWNGPAGLPLRRRFSSRWTSSPGRDVWPMDASQPDVDHYPERAVADAGV